MISIQSMKSTLQITFFPLLLAATLSAQQPPKITHVMASLSVNKDISREQIMKVMQQEVRDTVQLHLDGHIEQWYAKGDGKGVIFILNCKSIEEAKTLLDELPLIKGKLASFEYTALGPLTPLRLLLSPPPK
jgi:peptidyl-tRNA hydrolase